MQIHLVIPAVPPICIFFYCLITLLFTVLFAGINDIEQRKWYGWQILLLGLLWPITIPWPVLRFLRWFLFTRH